MHSVSMLTKKKTRNSQKYNWKQSEHTEMSLIHPFFLFMHVQVAFPIHFCVCTTMRPLSQRTSNMDSSAVPVWSVLQRLKLCSRGQSREGLVSAHAHSHCVTLNIIKHSPSVTHNTTKHSSGAMLLKQTLCWNPRGWGEWRRSWGGGCEGGQELMVFMLKSQRVGNTRNTIPMFSLPQLIRQNDRGSRFPYRESCHLDIYPH